MRVINSGFMILTEIDREEVLELIELAGRTCYRSVSGDDTAPKFVANLIKRGHESVLEQFNITVKIICDRGVMAELTRHRHASFSVESTRYVNYQKMTLDFIHPNLEGTLFHLWIDSMVMCEDNYIKMLECGATPEIARAVLPNSLATRLVMTANLREWRHIFKLRTSKASHPDMQALMIPMLAEFKRHLPEVFYDIKEDSI